MRRRMGVLGGNIAVSCQLKKKNDLKKCCIDVHRRSSRGHIFNFSPHQQSDTDVLPSICACSSNLTRSPCATRTGHDMGSHSTCPFLLKVVLVCLPYTAVTGNVDSCSKSVEHTFFPTYSSSAAASVRRSAWVAPRMVCARQRDRRSPPMPTWDASRATSSVGYNGRGGGTGAAGNQASVS